MRRRKPGGRLYPVKKEDDRYEVAVARQRKFAVTRRQSISPLAGYLLGVLYLRGQVDARHLGHYYSFLQRLPKGTLKSGGMTPRVQGGRMLSIDVGSKAYHRMIKEVGSKDIAVLHALTHDQLVVPVRRLVSILERVPLTRSGEQFSFWCESQHPRNLG